MLSTIVSSSPPVPIVIDAQGEPVADARVPEITFPVGSIDPTTGRVNFIVGAGVAKISVAGETILGVALC